MTTYKVLNPHPKVIEKWKSVRYLPDRVMIPQVESQFFKFIGQGKVIKLVDPAPDDPAHPREEEITIECTEDPQRPIKRQIMKFYRVGGNPEQLYYVEYLSGERFSGKPGDHTRIVGKFSEPDFAKERNRESGEVKITGHKDGIVRYEIPFTHESFTDPSTGEQTTLEALGKLRGERTWYYVISSGRKYELLDLTWDEFVNSSYADLVHRGQYNKWPEKRTPLQPEYVSTTTNTRTKVKAD